MATSKDPDDTMQQLRVYRLRDLFMEPARGTHKAASWLQFSGTLQIRLFLGGSDWEGVVEDEIEVRVAESELLVKCSRDREGLLDSVNGKFKKQVDPKLCFFGLEESSSRVSRKTLVISVAKKIPGTPWNNGVFHQQLFNHSYVGLGPNTRQAVDMDDEEIKKWVTLRSGLRRDIDDVYVTGRNWLCAELEQLQTREELRFRVILNQRKLNEVLEKIPYHQLWGIDVSEKYMKLFIRGDETSPVLLGELGGACVPEMTRMELTTITREVYGHRIAGTMETVPCLDVTLRKATGSLGDWPEPLRSREEDMNRPVGSLDDYVLRSLRPDPSPDRSLWTPDERANEHKEHGDAAFKEGNYNDAVVYYTRALRSTPGNEKLLSNRSGAYTKLSKFQLALDDALKAEEVNGTWPKVYFRKGQALRGLRRFDDARAAFCDGRSLEPGSADWDRELRRTSEMEAAVEARRAAHAIEAIQSSI